MRCTTEALFSFASFLRHRCELDEDREDTKKHLTMIASGVEMRMTNADGLRQVNKPEDRSGGHAGLYLVLL